MNTRKCVVWVSVLLAVTGLVRGEEDYWRVIKEYIQRAEQVKTREERQVLEKEIQEYFDSLTAQQFIIAGRQCSEEGKKICPDTVFCEGTNYLLGFFYVEYPKRERLKDLALVLKEIQDKGQTNFWRASLIDFLGDSRRIRLLTDEKLYGVIDKLDVVLSDKSEHYQLRIQSCETIRRALSSMEDRNLLADPGIKTRIENGETLDDLRKRRGWIESTCDSGMAGVPEKTRLESTIKPRGRPRKCTLPLNSPPYAIRKHL